MKHHKTRDRGSPPESVFAPTGVGKTRALTPEGFLLCSEVPIARSGWLYYAEGEVPLEADSYSRMIRVNREKAELKKPETIASFLGKPVVDNHPDEDVTPDNWEKYSVGTTLNVRYKDSEDEPDVGLLLADLLIMDADAIRAVQQGKREVSCGYDADYEQDGVGLGLQTNIIGNHVALVDRGRCGPRCSIGDHAPKEKLMAKKTPSGTRRVTLAAHIRQAFRDAEAAALEEMTGLGDGPEDEQSDALSDEGGDDKHTHVHVHLNGGPAPSQDTFTQDEPDPGGEEMPQGGDEQDPVEARFQALEQGHQQILQQLAQLQKMLQGGGEEASPEGTQDSAEDDMDGELDQSDSGGAPQPGKTQDSAALATGWQELVAQAEILVPGIRVPTFDAAAKRKTTVDSMCQFRRHVLRTLDSGSQGQALLMSVGGAYDLGKMDCAQASTLFRAAAGAKSLLNNARGATKDAGLPAPQVKRTLGIGSVADLQAAFQAHYGG